MLHYVARYKSSSLSARLLHFHRQNGINTKMHWNKLQKKNKQKKIQQIEKIEKICNKCLIKVLLVLWALSTRRTICKAYEMKIRLQMYIHACLYMYAYTYMHYICGYIWIWPLVEFMLQRNLGKWQIIYMHVDNKQYSSIIHTTHKSKSQKQS